MQSIESVYQKYKGQDLVVLGIDIGEGAGTVRNFVQQEHDYNWTFLLDGTGEVAHSYQATSIPMNFFIDAGGVIRAAQLGAISVSKIEELLTKAR
jgi:hypothetical protein